MNHFIRLLLFLLILPPKMYFSQLTNYSEFLNFGEKKVRTSDKNKVEVLGEVFKINIDKLKASGTLDIIFLIDGSSSVGENNFRSELKFVKKLLSDLTVDYDHTRVAIITFSSTAHKYIDHITKPHKDNNKCLLLNQEITKVKYPGGGTYTLGALKLAKKMFRKARNKSKKALFLVTDGFSNGGNPIPLANDLKENQQVTIFTIGIQNGNYKELYEMASSPGQFFSYLLDSFKEFENLARRALHVDLKSGDYIPLGVNSPCDGLCERGFDCCHEQAFCSCGTTTGHYSCTCKLGYQGSGLHTDSCELCPSRYYPSGPNLCLPCPDRHHITTFPVLGVQSCECEPGFKATEENHCEIVKCSKFKAPSHGFFSDNEICLNKVNSSCRVRCEVGYTLMGDSVRECQNDGTWSGTEPSCQVITCARLAPPSHGSMECSGVDLGIAYTESDKDLPVDAICRFDCRPGKTLLGSRQRTCLPLAYWDGLKARCKEIKCPQLPKVKNGRIEPASCTLGKQRYGAECKIVCDSGYEVEGPEDKLCTGNHGLWDSGFEESICKDVEPPKITCPQNVSGSTLNGRRFGRVRWEDPRVRDNSGWEELTIWMKPTIRNITRYKFKIGKTKITYFAQDAFRNRAKCTFYVNIIDEEVPTIEECVDPPTFLTTEKEGANITWDEPNIFDNSHYVKINRSHEFGYFPIGTTTVTYFATDNSGNVNNCSINITVEGGLCETFPDPIYGHSNCAPQEDGIQCVITCDEGYALPIMEDSEDSSVKFLCEQSEEEEFWYNQEGLYYPDCSVTELPKETEQDITVTIPTEESCNNLKDIENSIKLSLQKGCVDCTIETIGCFEDEKEKINIFKREVQFQEVPHRNKSHKRGRRKKINVKFQVKGQYINQTQITDLHLLNNTIPVQYEKPKFICPSGFVVRKNRCVQCPKGTFLNSGKVRCQSCHYGYFNDQLAQTQCTPCPLHSSTRKIHSKKAEDCKEQCPPGFHARKRTIKFSKRANITSIERASLQPFCRSCPIGTFQSEYGQLKCIPCSSGYTTMQIRSVNVHQCIATPKEICERTHICNAGVCVPDDLEYSCECPPDFVGLHCERELSPCDSNPCLNNGTCSALDSNQFQCVCPKGYKGKMCETPEENCILTCFNGGTCNQNDENDYFCLCPPGFGGDSCEIRITYCQRKICENHGTCIEELSTFRCECKPGFIGKRCHLLPCDYQPCKGKICRNRKEVNATKNSFTCVCPEGFTGSSCGERINVCTSNPCQNGGTCLNYQTWFRCVCPKLFRGEKCEIRRRTNYLLHFRRFSTTDYATLAGFQENLNEISACLWIQTLDIHNYGTLLSYATNDFDNAFTITDYTGLVIYINNKYVVTDILLNDGRWHHFCVSWSNNNGTYLVYVDGQLSRKGFGLSPNGSIKGNGKLVIGQEQDAVGGKFSQSESFIGKMAHFDVWSKALSQQEIEAHMVDCQEAMIGDVYGWPEIEENISGNVSIENSSFCKECEELKTLYNGVIHTVDNIAYYSCYKGFYLNNAAYSSGRRCTKAAKWEGIYEPYCRKIYCGYPGHIRNGFLMGTKYYYLDRITYGCYNPYILIGNRTITCTNDGTWYPTKPTCFGVQCKAFKKPNNSNLTVIADNSLEDFIEDQSDFDIGTQVEVVCNEKATLVGEGLITCQENGTWDFPPPECNPVKKFHISCDLEKIPPAPVNGFIVENTLHGVRNGTQDFIQYQCNEGFYLNGDNMTTCIVDGYWTHPFTSCKQK